MTWLRAGVVVVSWRGGDVIVCNDVVMLVVCGVGAREVVREGVVAR